jgi:hypothetical protein
LDGIFILELVQSAPAGVESLVDTAYESRVISGAMTLGPIYDDPCPAEVIKEQQTMRECQCNKLLRQFFVRNLSELLLELPPTSTTFSYVQPGCGVTYLPLKVSEGVNVSLYVAGSVVIVIVIFVTFLVARAIRTIDLEHFIKKGIWLLILKLVVGAGFIVVKIFSLIQVAVLGSQSSQLLFRALYGFVVGVSITAGIVDIAVRSMHFWVSLAYSEHNEMPVEIKTQWARWLSRSTLMTLGAEDLPLLVMTFVAIIQQAAHERGLASSGAAAVSPLLVTLVMTSFFAGSKLSEAQQQLLEVYRRLFAKKPQHGQRDDIVEAVGNPFAVAPDKVTMLHPTLNETKNHMSDENIVVLDVSSSDEPS